MFGQQSGKSLRGFVDVNIPNMPPQKIPIVKNQVKAFDLQSLVGVEPKHERHRSSVQSLQEAAAELNQRVITDFEEKKVPLKAEKK